MVLSQINKIKEIITVQLLRNGMESQLCFSTINPRSSFMSSSFWLSLTAFETPRRHWGQDGPILPAWLANQDRIHLILPTGTDSNVIIKIIIIAIIHHIVWSSHINICVVTKQVRDKTTRKVKKKMASHENNASLALWKFVGSSCRMSSSCKDISHDPGMIMLRWKYEPRVKLLIVSRILCY